MSIADFTTKELPNWCHTCGDFNISLALKTALSDLKLLQENVVIISGIGCGSKMPHFLFQPGRKVVDRLRNYVGSG